MAEHRAQTITVKEIEQAVNAAVQQLQQQKATHANELARGGLIMGRWIKEALPQAEAETQSKEITRQVTAKVSGLKANPFTVAGHGGTTMGFILVEE